MPLADSTKKPDCGSSWTSGAVRERDARGALPESLWQAAVDLAKQYEVFRTACPVRLDYRRLKKRLGGGGRAGVANHPKLALWNWEGLLLICRSASSSLHLHASLRIQWKSVVAPDWTGLLRARRKAEERFRDAMFST